LAYDLVACINILLQIITFVFCGASPVCRPDVNGPKERMNIIRTEWTGTGELMLSQCPKLAYVMSRCY